MEPEIATLLKNYSAELKKWKEMFQTFNNSFTANVQELGDIVKPAFEKAQMIKADGMIILDERTSQHPKDWIDVFKIILFDDTTNNSEVLFNKLLKFSKDTRNGMENHLNYWKERYPNIFGYLLEVLPKLRKNLKIDITNEQIRIKREQLFEMIEQITVQLEKRL